MDNKASFEERLELGNDKEYYVNDIFNLCGIPSILNNIENVTDMDLYLTKDNLYVDVKYLESYFDATIYDKNLSAENCLIMSKDHLKRYEWKKEETGIDTWVAFLINFEKLGVFELRFIRTEYIMNLIQEERAIVRPIKSGNRKKMVVNINKNDCLDMMQFTDYIKNLRSIQN